MEHAVMIAEVLPWTPVSSSAAVAMGMHTSKACAANTDVAVALEAPGTMERRGPCRG